MMKYTGSLALGMGVVFGVPAFTFGGGLPGSLEEALDETVRAIDVLNQVQNAIETGATLPSGSVLKLTESSILDVRGRDDLLNALRNEVGGLQAQADMAAAAAALDANAADSGPMGPSFMGPTGATPTDPDAAAAGVVVAAPGMSLTDTINYSGVSIGMSPTLRTSIAMGAGQGSSMQDGAGTRMPSAPPYDAAGPGLPELTSKPGSGLETSTETTNLDGSSIRAAKNTASPASPEGAGYSAAPLLQAKACYKAGRYQRGLDVLTGVQKTHEVTFWKAQLESKLGNLEYAVNLYTELRDDASAGKYTDLAKDQIEFLEWRQEFEGNQKAGDTK